MITSLSWHGLVDGRVERDRMLNSGSSLLSASPSRYAMVPQLDLGSMRQTSSHNGTSRSRSRNMRSRCYMYVAACLGIGQS